MIDSKNTQGEGDPRKEKEVLPLKMTASFATETGWKHIDGVSGAQPNDDVVHAEANQETGKGLVSIYDGAGKFEEREKVAGEEKKKDKEEGEDTEDKVIIHRQGYQASNAVANEVSRVIVPLLAEPNRLDPADVEELLLETCRSGQEVLQQQNIKAATTGAIGIIYPAEDGKNYLSLASIGDSRLYVVNRNGKVRLLTTDHRHAEESHVLTRSFRAEGFLQPDIYSIPLEEDDCAVLGVVDGIYNTLKGTVVIDEQGNEREITFEDILRSFVLSLFARGKSLSELPGMLVKNAHGQRVIKDGVPEYDRSIDDCSASLLAW
jgi:serine/threonine protein phosphatase PrpC